MSGADFNNEELGAVMIDRKIYGDIIKYYRKLADGKQSIAYCTNVAHSKSICDLFNENGIPAVHIDASTPEKQRLQIMDDFCEGKYKVLCNCNLISEGITLPECECCMLLRPTQSETLYVQQACRCLTPLPNKKAIIIDFVGNCFAHGTPTEKRVYSLKMKTRIKNASREPDVVARECKNCFKVYRGDDRICPYCGFDNGKTKKQIQEDKKAELERIKELERIHKEEEKERKRLEKEKEAQEKKRLRMEVGMARDYGALVRLARERGYQYPEAWAKRICEARRHKGIRFK